MVSRTDRYKGMVVREVDRIFLVRGITTRRQMVVHQKPKFREVTQRILLVMAGVCAILSLIAPLRLGASLAMRGISVLSISASKVYATKIGLFLHCVKISALALGIIGLAASLPAFIVASLGVDIGMQLIRTFQELLETNYFEAGVHFGLFIVDTLLLLATLLGSWEIMVAGLLFNSAFMFFFCAFGTFVVAEDGNVCIDRALIYTLLFALSYAGAMITAGSTNSYTGETMRPSLPPVLFPTLPLGGTTLAVAEQNTQKLPRYE